MPDVKIGLIGGSGLGQLLTGREGERVEVDTPFGRPSAAITETTWDGVDLAILPRHGVGHTLNPSEVPYRANIFVLKKLGVTHIIASGATGSLREGIAPGDLVITDQTIDKTYRRANTFYEKAAVHVELAEPMCPVTRAWLLRAAAKLEGIKIHESGTYVVMEGPGFSTRAESHLHRSWGADLIGMTLMPEAKLAREAEIAYAHIGLPTDYDCWKPHEGAGSAQDLLAEIIGNLETAVKNSIELIQAALSDIDELAATPSPSHDALKLAIWSEKTKIPDDEIERLSVLWGRYFE